MPIKESGFHPALFLIPYPLYGYSGLSLAASGDFEIYFDNTVTDAAFRLVTNRGESSFLALLDGTEVESYQANTTVVYPGGNNWFGFTGIEFDTLRLLPGGTNGVIHIDDLSFNVSAVPVPAGVWLFGTGLILLLGFNKRRKAT